MQNILKYAHVCAKKRDKITGSTSSKALKELKLKFKEFKENHKTNANIRLYEAKEKMGR